MESAFYSISNKAQVYKATNILYRKSPRYNAENLGDGLTINVPVVYMGRYVVVLRGDYP